VSAVLPADAIDAEETEAALRTLDAAHGQVRAAVNAIVARGQANLVPDRYLLHPDSEETRHSLERDLAVLLVEPELSDDVLCDPVAGIGSGANVERVLTRDPALHALLGPAALRLAAERALKEPLLNPATVREALNDPTLPPTNRPLLLRVHPDADAELDLPAPSSARALLRDRDMPATVRMLAAHETGAERLPRDPVYERYRA
jgi:hypothetical protein